MRIAVFSDHFYPELGGIQDSIESLARGLAARGHQVDFYVPRYYEKEYIQAELPVGEIELGPSITVHRLASLPYPGSTQQTRFAIPSYALISSIRKKRPDIIHSQTIFGLGLEAIAASKLWGVPLLSTNHMAMEVYATYLSPAFLKNFKRYLRWYYNQCDFVSAPAAFVFDELGKLAVPHEIISNPIDQSIFRLYSEEERQQAKRAVGLSGPTVVYAGKLAQEKRIDLLIQALPLLAQKIPGITLALAGHGDEAPSLAALAESLGVEEHVRFFGTLPKPKLAELFAASDAFVTLSMSEVQSMSQLQALACGLPVVCARSKALEEGVAGSQSVVLVDAEDLGAFVDITASILADPALQHQLRDKSAASVEPYSLASIAAQWEGVYQKVIAAFSISLAEKASGR